MGKIGKEKLNSEQKIDLIFGLLEELPIKSLHRGRHIDNGKRKKFISVHIFQNKPWKKLSK